MTPPRSTTPSLRDLALDHLGDLAKALRLADPTLTREAAVSKAAQSVEGKQAYALYRAYGAELPWPAAVGTIVKAELSKAAPRRKAELPPNAPADVLYTKLIRDAVAAFPGASSQSAAIADYLHTTAGQTTWRLWNAARESQDE